MRRSLFFLLFLSLLTMQTRMSAQNLFACDPGHPGALICQNSCIECDINGKVDINNQFLPPSNLTLCLGAIVLENPRWYGFIAGTTDITFNIKYLSCNGTAGLQGAIIRECTGVVECNPLGTSVTGGSMTLAATGLIVGAPYQLVVDGIGGEICTYQIEILNGSAMGPALGPVGSIQGLTQVCPDGTVTYTVPPVANAVTYTWTAPAGASINGGGNNVTVAAGAGGNSVDIHFGGAGGTICVTAANACDPPVQVCKSVSNVPIPITVLDEVIVCNEESPYEWTEEPHTLVFAPGTYTLTSTPYSSYLGCDSLVRQTIKILPKKQKNLGPVWLCQDQCFFVGPFEYCNPGTYTDVISADNGCDSTVTFTLIKIPVNAVIQQPDTITCAVPTVTLSGSGSTTGTSVFYKWLNPSGVVISNTITASASAPGVYTLIVQNSGGGVACFDTAYVTVPGELSVPQADAGPNLTLTCSVTQLQLQGTGSMPSPPFSYMWTASNGGSIIAGSNTLTPTINASGTYKLRVTNNLNGCTAVSVTVVSAQTQSPNVSVVGGTYSCSFPTVTLQSTTNAVNATYAWTGPNGFTSAAPNPTVNVGGTYTLIVTDGPSGCTNSATATVVANDATPGASATGGTLNCTTASINLNGNSPTPNVTYAWTGPNGFTSSNPNPSVSVDGTYQLVVTAPNGCTSTATAVVSTDEAAPGAALTVSGNLNCNNAAVNLIVTSTANPLNLQHLWTNPDGTTVNTGIDAFLSVNQPGNYTVVVTNSVNGCTSIANFTVVQNAAVGVAVTGVLNAACFGTSTGGVTVNATGGNGTYSYHWSNDGVTPGISGLPAGTYSVTVTDGENCSAVTTATVSEPEELLANATATPQTVNGATDGTASASPTGGSPNYAYVWDTGALTASITNLAPGSYTVTVTDANGCSVVQTVTVNGYNCLIQAAISTTDATCAGSDNGTATVNVTGGTQPFSYEWSTDEITPSISGLEPGLYSVTLTDAANCPVELSFDITEPAPLSANATASGTSGPNVNDGTVSAGPTGGINPYTYFWNTGDSTSTVDSLAGGDYTVVVTDSHGCTAEQTVTVSVGNCGLVTDILTIAVTCNGQSNGTATVVLTGGNEPFTYNWSSGGDEASETGLPAGDHIVTITDVNGCEVVATATITEPTPLTVASVFTTPTPCPATPEGTATVTASGGTGTLTVLWSDDQTGFTAIGLIAGTYTATITDANGCTTVATAVIDAVDDVPPVINGGAITLPLGSSGEVTLTPQNIGATITDNCLVSSITITPDVFDCSELGPHDVLVEAVDDAGNASTATLTITIVDDAAPELDCPSSITRCFGNFVVQYDAPTASDNCLGIGGSFDFVAGLPSGSTFPVGVTTNIFTYTDAQGNVGTCSFEVTILSQLSILIQNVKDDNGNPNNGAIDVSVSGSLSPYTYVWFVDGNLLPDTTEDLTGLAGGIYTVVVTDANGCTLDSQDIPVQSLVSTDTPDWASELGVFPNPTSGQVSVTLPESVVGAETRILVFDATGRRVAEQFSRQQSRIELDLTGQAGGLYSILIQIDGKTVARKLVVSR